MSHAPDFPLQAVNPPTRAHHQFWPHRLPRAIGLPETSLWDNLATNARRYPDKPAVVFFERALSYAQMAREAERLAACLHSLGVRRGDRVALCMQNCPQLVTAHFAILRANAVVVPVNPMNRAEELKHYILDPDTKVVITSSDLAFEWAKASNALEPAQRLSHLLVTHLSEAFDAESEGEDAPPPAWRDWLRARPTPPDLQGGRCVAWSEALKTQGEAPPLETGARDLAVLPYTSGTTGLPKGCMLLHANIMHNAMAAVFWGGGTPESVTLAVVPMFHATGNNVMHTSIYSGATLVVMPRWDRDLAGRLISRRHVTGWANIPTMVIDLLASPNFAQYDMSSLLSIGGGGAAMPQAVAQRLQEAYNLKYIEGYGLTETAAPSHSNFQDRPKQQCLGVPYIGVDSRVINPETLQEVAQGEQGEIITHGPMVFQGYWKRPDATKAAFIEIEGKRFFRTGDLGKVDEEGYFFITDRLKRMINASGYKVWPAEVEALMFKHPAIQEACVIASKDAYRGESVKAMVVLRPAFKGQVSEADILAWCRGNMAVYKAPRTVQFLDALPKSGSGKVMWRAMQEAEMGAAGASV